MPRDTYFASLAGEGTEMKTGRRFAAHFAHLIHLERERERLGERQKNGRE